MDLWAQKSYKYHIYSSRKTHTLIFSFSLTKDPNYFTNLSIGESFASGSSFVSQQEHLIKVYQSYQDLVTCLKACLKSRLITRKSTVNDESPSHRERDKGPSQTPRRIP